MPLETATFIHELNPANPLGGDVKSQGDDHLRLIKSTVQNTFTNVDGQVTASHTDLNKTTNIVDGVVVPTFSAQVGITTITVNNLFHVRVGNIVHVEGGLTIDVSAASASFNMTVPIARSGNFADTISAIGRGASDNNGASLIVSSVNGTLNQVSVQITNAIDATYRFSYSYKLN
jgi:hypothetical protein